MNLSKEIEEGNIEYKRYLVNIDNERLNHLITQMNWRLNEGNNIAIYYIGVDDDGSPYDMNSKEMKETMNNFKKMVNSNDAYIIDKTKIFTNSFKITIKRNSIKYKEVRIVLIGPTNSGKTTFLSNIILDKIDGKIEARIFMMNHKHELETKKTSSFNCHYKLYNQYKYTFIEAPGSIKYIKTKYRILLGTKPDIILLFPGNNFDEFLCQQLNKKYGTKYIKINPFDSNSIYYCKQHIDKDKFFDLLENNLPDNFNDMNNMSKLQFNIMNVYPHIDMGLVVSGFLCSGKLYVNQSIYWTYKNNSIQCIVKSIHINGEPYNSINECQILTLCLEPLEIIKKKWKYGQLMEEKNNYHNIMGTTIGYYDNQYDYIENINKDNFIVIDNKGIIDCFNYLEYE
jgi:GTPase